MAFETSCDPGMMWRCWPFNQGCAVSRKWPTKCGRVAGQQLAQARWCRSICLAPMRQNWRG